MKTRIYSFLACTAIILSACHDDNNNEGGPGGSVKAEFSASIQAMESVSRASAQSWSTNDKIGLFMVEHQVSLRAENIIDGIDNRPFTVNTDGSLVNSGSDIVYPTDIDVDFFAYYPYNAHLTDYELPFDVSDQENPAVLNFMFSNNAQERGIFNPKADLVFKHQMAKLSFTVVKSSEIASVTIPQIDISINGMPTTATYSMRNLRFKDFGGIGTISPRAVTASQSYEAIILPQEAGEYTGRTVTVTVPSMPDLEGATLDLVSGVVFTAGYDYHYDIHISKKGIVFSDPSIKPWIQADALTGNYTKTYQIGDYYPNPDADVSVSTEKAAIEGVVFSSGVGADGKRFVRILSLTHLTRPAGLSGNANYMLWANYASTKDEGLTSETDGYANTKKMMDAYAFGNDGGEIDDFASKYSIFKSVSAQYTKGFYIPSKNELKELAAGFCGLQLVWDKTPEAGEIADWGDHHKDIPNWATYADARTAFANKVTQAGGSQDIITTNLYYSSTEYSADPARVWAVNMNYGRTYAVLKYGTSNNSNSNLDPVSNVNVYNEQRALAIKTIILN